LLLFAGASELLFVIVFGRLDKADSKNEGKIEGGFEWLGLFDVLLVEQIMSLNVIEEFLG
jgi:hypothetical protein